MRSIVRTPTRGPTSPSGSRDAPSDPAIVQLDGPRGWLMVGAAFLSLYTIFGVAYSFGGFFNPMADEFGSERSATAFFFALTTFLYFSLGLITGPISDRLGPRPVMLFGGTCMALGLLATSRVDNLYTGYLTYGLGVGIGVACGYVPVVAAVGGWFEVKRTTALGISVAGIGVGTLVNAPVVERLIERYGWRDTYVILAVGSASLLFVAAMAAQRPPSMTGTTESPPLRTLIGGSSSFWTLYASMAILSFPLFLPFVFLGDYLELVGSTRSAGLLLGLIGLASVTGRLGLGALASRFPTIRLYQGSILTCALSYFLWLVADGNYGVLIAFAIIMGVSYGGFIALAPAVTAEIFGPLGLGGVLGALYTAAGVGGLVGPPTMGLLIDRFGYTPSILTAVAIGLLSFVLLLPLSRPSSPS